MNNLQFRSEINRLEDLLNSHNCPMSFSDMSNKIIELKKEHNTFMGFTVWSV